MIALVMACVTATFTAWVITGAVLQYAVRRDLLDVPNHRSSHSAPTPRGGGLAIAVVALGATAIVTLLGLLAWTTGMALFVGGGVLAAIGWLDDHRHVPAPLRAVAQLFAAGWAVYWIGVPETLWLGPWSLPMGRVGAPLAVVALVWLTNLFNFMDGIDGIAAGEAVTVAVIGGALLFLAGAPGPGALALLVASAATGFLVWNWPPARIFMGDVGSGLLGFLLGGIALVGWSAGAVPLLVWAILLGVFLFDATVTLIRRVVGGERFFEAHRRHAYQRAVQAGYSHLQVTGSVLVLNSILAGVAVAVWHWPAAAVPAVGAALTGLAAIYAGVERMRPMWAESRKRPVGEGAGMKPPCR